MKKSIIKKKFQSLKINYKIKRETYYYDDVKKEIYVQRYYVMKEPSKEDD